MATTWTNPASLIKEKGILTKDEPITHCKASIAELQARCALRVKMDVEGLEAHGVIQGNTLTISGSVKEKYTHENNDDVNPAGGDDTNDGDGGEGQGGGATELALSHAFVSQGLKITLAGRIGGVAVDVSTTIPLADCGDSSDSSSSGA